MNPEEYTAGKSLVQSPQEPIIIKETSWFKLSLLFIIIFLIGSGSAFAVFALGFSPQFINDQDCNELSEIGYSKGVVEMSRFVFETKTLPVFVNESGEVVIQYLNITDGIK